MNLAMFNTLRAIMEHGNFSAAADAVGCSPSAVSLQVKQMELFFGQPLFDRSTRIVVPTPLAKELGGAVGEFLGRIDALRARPTIAVAGKLRIGVITSMQSDVMPRALHRLRGLHPALEIRVAPLNDTDELLAELKAGRIDAALLVRPEAGGSSRLVWRDLHRQPFVLLAPRESAVATPRKLFEAHEWIGYDLSLPAGRQAARFVRALAPEARCTTELRSMDAIVAMVSLGMGITVVPQPRRPLLAAYSVREVALGHKAPSRRIACVWRKTDDGSRNIIALAEAFTEAFKTQ
ncbi:LysR family transcriptional regulator [Polaromonas sp. JS666]|uniref:LysR family transcriptional regulator n=1 Tax=Polaromonas sp. (strain JS666 / ATCC BAA-500) TaxID=296591 RepID=UPI0000464291|nr:LysR family transcriptional regulator [Polaromonas sp. JS666]ABE43997.1 transcriptional regulator, LysR family [Polaromonas sp. JS666]